MSQITGGLFKLVGFERAVVLWDSGFPLEMIVLLEVSNVVGWSSLHCKPSLLMFDTGPRVIQELARLITRPNHLQFINCTSINYIVAIKKKRLPETRKSIDSIVFFSIDKVSSFQAKHPGIHTTSSRIDLEWPGSTAPWGWMERHSARRWPRPWPGPWPVKRHSQRQGNYTILWHTFVL